MDVHGHLPVVVALAAAPEEEAALAALGVVVVLGASGPAPPHVGRQVAPGEESGEEVGEGMKWQTDIDRTSAGKVVLLPRGPDRVGEGSLGVDRHAPWRWIRVRHVPLAFLTAEFLRGKVVPVSLTS